EPRLSDIALGSAVDTAMRSQIVWQVRSFKSSDIRVQMKTLVRLDSHPADVQGVPWLRNKPRLRVRIKPGARSKDPCRPSFATAWQGQENQLYRVEIHDGTPPEPVSPVQNPEQGKAANYPTSPVEKPGTPVEGGKPADQQAVTFKWSRENGSVAARVAELKGAAVVIFPGQLKAGGF